MYETRNQPKLSRRAFTGRMARHGGLALAIVVDAEIGQAASSD